MADDKGNPPAPAATPPQVAPILQYVDRNDCTEIFADTVTKMSFDGQTLRLEFGVTRMDDVKPNTAPTGRVLPACRVVLPPQSAIDLMNRMQQITAALVQAGYVKRN